MSVDAAVDAAAVAVEKEYLMKMYVQSEYSECLFLYPFECS
jgi:hypothetical protein